MQSPNQEVVGEIYRALVLLGAQNDLLGTVGSWGNSLNDADVLSGLRAWNVATLREITERIEHYEISSHQSDYIPVENRQSPAPAR